MVVIPFLSLFFLNGISTFVGDKGVHAFSECISPKVKVVAQLELELVYFDVVVQHFPDTAGEARTNS